MEGSPLSNAAIIFTEWTWQMFNAPERIAICLNRAGWKILYCENPASFLRRLGGKRLPLVDGIEKFRPEFAGHRLNFLPAARRFQARLIVRQILEQARQMGIEKPMAIYPHGYWLVDVARELKERGIFTVYVCMDHLEEHGQQPEALAEPADLVLTIPRTMYVKLKARFGEKVRWIPQLGPDLRNGDAAPDETRILSRLAAIPGPRLGYVGRPVNRLRPELVDRVLSAHPDWHLITCGPVTGVRHDNLHDIGWISARELATVCRKIDVGFMPYDCSRDFNLHCVPLKLFDYFAAGLPVVSTPIISLWEHRDLVYLGDTPGELAEGIRKALAEPPDDPRREERRRIARAHSLDEMSGILSSILIQGSNR